MNKKKSVREKSTEALLTRVISLAENQLSNLEYQILTEVLLNHKNFNDLREPTRLTSFRIKQIFEMGMKRMFVELAQINWNIRSLDDTRIKNSNLKQELALAKKRLAEMELAMDRQKGMSPKIKQALATLIEDAPFSIRVKTACSIANLRTLEDVIKYSRVKFMALRNCGKLSADEVDAYLKSKGLSWGMKI